MQVWSVISSRLGGALCLDYGNKILNQKLLRGEENESLKKKVSLLCNIVFLVCSIKFFLYSELFSH